MPPVVRQRPLLQAAIGILFVAALNFASTITPSRTAAGLFSPAAGAQQSCPSGYMLVGNSCVDVNECATNNAGCGSLVQCFNTPGSFSCGSCPSGYALNGTNCVDVNECEIDNGGCDGSDQCTNVPGSLYCGDPTCLNNSSCDNPCPAGYAFSFEDSTCEDVNECATNNGGCFAGSTCTNVAGSFACGACPPGYSGDGVTCTPSNLCGTNNGGCSANAVCGSVNGSLSCTCGAGYAGNGFTCADVNECATNNGGCSTNPMVACTNRPGSFSCGSCPVGYTGNGITCADINECAINNGGCSVNATCTNTLGSRSCGCNPGFSGDGVTCTDINECAINNGGCDPLTTCTNTVGSFTCGSCPSGYFGNGVTCTDVNECAVNNGGCSTNPPVACLNRPGGFSCGACPVGYTGDGVTCTDVNECSFNNGGCDPLTTCTNTVGSFTCSACPAGYSGTGQTGCTAAPACVPAPSSLVGWWRGEGDATDATGADNGTLVGAPSIGFTSTGKVGGAFTFSGSGYLSIPPIASISGNNARTIAFWMKPSAGDLQSDQHTPFFYGTAGVGHESLGIDLDNQAGDVSTVKLQVFTWQDDINGIDTGVPPDTWFHVAVTYDPVTTNVSLYVNGTLRATKTQSGGLQTTATSIDVGHFPGFGGSPPEAFFVGDIDEVLFFNRALIPAEIASIVGADTTGTCPLVCTAMPSGLVSWWSGNIDTRDQYGPYDLTASGNVPIVPGRVGNAFAFDGTGSLQGPAMVAGAAVTFDAWVNPSVAGQSATILSYLAHGQSQTYQLALLNGVPLFESSGAPPALSNAALPVGVYSHIVGTCGARLLIWVNGVATGSGLQPLCDLGDSVQIGTGFQGVIDEVHEFNRELSQADITSLYSAGSSGACSVPPQTRLVDINWSTPGNIVYTTPLGAGQLDAAATLDAPGIAPGTVPVIGTFTYTPPAGTVLNAGSSLPLNASFAPDDARYTPASGSTTINVLKATPTITWPAPATLEYGTALSGVQLDAAASFNNTSLAGTFTYTPPASTVLPIGPQPLSVTFTPLDGANYNTATASVMITVVDTTPPTLQLPGNFVVPAGPTGTTAVTFTPTAQDKVDGSVPVTCVPASGFAFPIGTTLVSCSATDAHHNTASGGFSVTVTDAPPIAAPDTATTPVGTAVTIPVLANDTDPDGGTLSVSAVSTPSHGTAAIVSGGILYTPSAGFSGTDTFTYTVIDHQGGSSVGQVTITVQSQLGRFVAFSRNQTWLRARSQVITGDVGANTSQTGPPHRLADDADGDDDVTVEMRVGVQAAMLQPGSRVVGDTVWLRAGSSVYDVIDNELIDLSRTNVILGSVTSPVALPYLTMPALPSIAPGTQDVTVTKNGTVTLAPGRYRTVTVRQSGKLILSGGLYQIQMLDLGQDASVVAHAATDLRIQGELDTDARAHIIVDPTVSGLRASQFMISVAATDPSCIHDGSFGGDGDDAGPTAVHVGADSEVSANIYAPNGTLWLKARTTARGAFIGGHVRIGEQVQLTLDSAFQ